MPDAEGPAAQRREAVRAPMQTPVTLEDGEQRYTGTTADVSEGGLRVLLTAVPPSRPVPVGDPEPIAAGQRVRVLLRAGGGDLDCAAQVLSWRWGDDRRAEARLRLLDLAEAEQDLLRREVFADLRALRAAGLY